MKKALFTAAVLAGLAVLSVASADASTVTYTASIALQPMEIQNGVLSLQKFNASLGTLTSVTIALDTNAQTQFTVTATGATNATGHAYAEISFNLVDPSGIFTADQPQIFVRLPWNKQGNAVYSFSDVKAGTPVVSSVYSKSIGSGDIVYTDSPALSEFTGSDLIDLTLNTVTNTWSTFSTGDGGVTGNTKADAKATVTYTYTAAPVDAVPEPATVALFVGGIGMLVIGQRIRRRSH